MKLSPLLLGSLASAWSANAQYFSAGWTPGQAIQTDTPSTGSPGFTPGAQSIPQQQPVSLKSLFDISNILKSPPVHQLFERFGVNITEKLEKAEVAAKVWDERIPLITDSNYHDLIVNEVMTEEEEKDRVWFIVISVTRASQDGVSKIVDSVFDAAYNVSLQHNDIPHVKWGRIDYLNVTTVTTKWVIWQAPIIVLLKDRGQTLRFYRPSNIRLNPDVIYEFLKTDGWTVTPPWRTAFSPGGDREYLMDYLAIVLTMIYDKLVLVPKWLTYIITGGFASLVIGLLHGKAQVPPAAARPSQIQPSVAAESAAAQSSGSSGTAKRVAKQRKGGNK